MEDRPRFLQSASTGSLDPIHRPVPVSRRGEGFAWLSAGLAALGSLILTLRGGQLPDVGIGLVIVLVLAAGLITLGNWLDRRTRIELLEQRVLYHSPLRQVNLPYADIQRLTASRLRDAWRVGVVGPDRGFTFRTGTTLRFAGMDRLTYGFAGGEGLAAALRQRAELGPAIWDGQQWVSRRTEPGRSPAEVIGPAPQESS